MVARLIDPVLHAADEMMMQPPQDATPMRLRFGEKMEDARALFLALEAVEYGVFRLSVDVGGTARSGDLTLIFPKDVLFPKVVAAAVGEDEDGFDLGGPVLTAPVTLDAVLQRLEMPLSRVCGLKPGDVLPVSRAAMGKAELLGPRGFLLSKVCLGQINGFRAVRLGAQEPGDDDMPMVQRSASAGQQAMEEVPTLPDPVDTGDGPMDLDQTLIEAGLSDLVEGGPVEVPPELPGDLSLDVPVNAELDPGSATPVIDLPDIPALTPLTDSVAEGDAGLPDLPDLPKL